MFVYCANNPVNYHDSCGTCLEYIWNWICSLFTDSETSDTAPQGVAVNMATTGVAAMLTPSPQPEPKPETKPLPHENVDEAAHVSAYQLNELTQTDNCERAQGIIYDEATGTYGLTEIVTGNHASVEVSELMNRNDVLAVVHSHPFCSGHVPNQFSVGSIDEYDNATGDWAVTQKHKKDMYLASPDGDLRLLEWDKTYNFEGENVWIFPSFRRLQNLFSIFLSVQSRLTVCVVEWFRLLPAESR